MKVICFLTACLFISVAGAANPKLADLPDNTWMVLDSTGMQVDGRFAYSGGAYDRANNRFFCFGGGHLDGYKNDVWYFDIATDAWNQQYQSDPASAYTCANVDTLTPGMLKSSGLPASRHTYDMIEYMDHINKVIMWSGPTYSGIWSCGGNTLPRDTWLWDFGSGQWQYANVARGVQPSGEAKCGAYNPLDSLYYAYNNDNFYSYNAAADLWSLVTVNGSYKPTGYDHSMVVDRKNGFFYLNAASISRFNPRTRTWAALTPMPANTDDNPSFDEVWDDILFFNNNQSKVAVFHTADSSWDVVTPQGTVSVGSDRAYGRFFYDPVDSVHLYVTQVNYMARVYAYRYRRNAPVADVTLPSVPSNAVASALSDTTVRVTWDASADPENPVARYVIKRDGLEVGRTEGLAFTDSGLTELTQYQYTIEAINVVHLRSLPSVPADVTTLSDQVKPMLDSYLPMTVRCSTLVLNFSEPLDSASAADITHYTLDNGGAITGATVSADRKSVRLSTVPCSFDVEYTLTLNGIADQAAAPNIILPDTRVSFTVPDAVLLADFGATAQGNLFGLAGWNRVVMDVYIGYTAAGPGGIFTNGSGGYDFRGVIGAPRDFAAGEKVVVTWYNNTDTIQAFTPQVSFDDSGRPANPPGTWADMSAQSIPARRLSESEYTLAGAGNYTLVNVSASYNPPGYADGLLVCDKIELFRAGQASVSLLAPGAAAPALSASPNPFSGAISIQAASQAFVRIFDIRGRMVASYILSAGEHAWLWRPAALPAGLYLVKAKMGEKSLVRKVLYRK